MFRSIDRGGKTSREPVHQMSPSLLYGGLYLRMFERPLPTQPAPVVDAWALHFSLQPKNLCYVPVSTADCMTVVRY